MYNGYSGTETSGFIANNTDTKKIHARFLMIGRLSQSVLLINLKAYEWA